MAESPKDDVKAKFAKERAKRSVKEKFKAEGARRARDTYAAERARRATAAGSEDAKKDAPDRDGREGVQDKEGKIIDAVFRDVAKDTNTSIGTLRSRSGQSVVDAVQARLGGMDPKSEDYARIINQISPDRRDAVRAAVERQIAGGKGEPAKDTEQPKEKSAEELVDDLRALSEKMDKEALEKFLKEPKDFLGNKIERTLTDAQKNFLRSVWEQLLKEDATPAVFDALLKEVAKEIDQDVAGGILRAHNDFLKKERGPLMQQVQELRDDLQAMRAEMQSIRAQQQAPQAQVMPGAIPPYVGRGEQPPYPYQYPPQQPGGQWVWQPAPAPQYPPQGMPQQPAARTEAAPAQTAAEQKATADKALADAVKNTTPETQTPAPAQAVEEMRKAIEGKLPSSIESALMRKRGETPMWKRVRNAVGLMIAGGLAGATVVSTLGVPAILSGVLAGSQLAAFAPILTGIGAGVISGGVAGGLRGALDARSAVRFARDREPGTRISWNEIFTHMFRKSLVGSAFGGVGGGIGAEVMQVYGDQIRAGAGALGDWANQELIGLKKGVGSAGDWLSSTWHNVFSGAPVDVVAPATHVAPGCTMSDATSAALQTKIDALRDHFDIRDFVMRQKLSVLLRVVEEQGIQFGTLKNAFSGVQTDVAALNNFVGSLAEQQRAGFAELFNKHGSIAYYFFNNQAPAPDTSVVLPDAAPTPAPDPVPAAAERVAEVVATSDLDKVLIAAFNQPVTNGGVWTAAEKVLQAAGVSPQMGKVGNADALSYLTDLFEDYTQDGTAPGTRATSYFRELGQGLLERMTGQAGATQVTIRNPINTAELFGNPDIQKDALRRLGENVSISGSLKEQMRSVLAKVFSNAAVALSK